MGFTPEDAIAGRGKPESHGTQQLYSYFSGNLKSYYRGKPYTIAVPVGYSEGDLECALMKFRADGWKCTVKAADKTARGEKQVVAFVGKADERQEKGEAE